METLGHTEALARYTTHMTFDDLPEAVIEQARLCIMDALGIALASQSIEDSAELLLDFVRKMGGKKEASLLNYYDRVPCVNAILANSYLTHCIGFDDVHNEAIAHIGAAVIPTVMATAEREVRGGKDVIAAVVVGYDVAARVSIALDPVSMYAQGFHPSSICIPFGCAAAAGKVLKLDEDQMGEALGLAGVQAAGLMIDTEKGPTSFLLQYGKAAQSGFLSAELAELGFTGPEMILEGKKGFCEVFSEKADLKKLTSRLGKKFEIMENSLKLYPCCHFLHSGINAITEILHMYGVEANNIERLRLKLPSASLIALEVDNREMPENRRSARANALYIMSVAAVERDAVLDVNKLLEKKRYDPKIRKFLPKVEIAAESELDEIYPKKWPAIVEAKTKDGNKYTHRVDVPKGDPGNALTKGEVEDKFMKLTEGVLGRQKVEKLLEIINKLEQLDDITQLIKLLKV